MMPIKYQPDYVYLRHVPLRRVHLFTFIQIIGMILLCVCKMVKQIAILFPLMVGSSSKVLKISEVGMTFKLIPNSGFTLGRVVGMDMSEYPQKVPDWLFLVQEPVW